MTKWIATLGLGALLGISSQSLAGTLYQTGWEATPASPAWNTGNIKGQNSWTGVGAISGHQVVNSGVDVSGVIVNAQAGSRMHQSLTPAPGASGYSYDWVDVSGGWNGRPGSDNTAIGEMDLFIPSTDTTDQVAHGALMFGQDAGASLIGGWVVENNGRGLFMYDGAGNPIDALFAVPADTWTHISFAANFSTSQLALYANNVLKAVGTFSPATVVGVADFDLYNENFNTTGGAGARVFTDNFKVSTAASVPEPMMLGAIAMTGLLFMRRRAI